MILTVMFSGSCVVVKSLTEAFQRADTDRDGWVQMSYEQFMQMVLEVSLSSSVGVRLQSVLLTVSS
jgi:hypothetical protein